MRTIDKIFNQKTSRDFLSRPQDGFTLLELSFVILISGIIFAAFASIASAYYRNIQEEKFEKVIANANRAISVYYSGNLHYPCPADPALVEGDPNFGKADCSLPPSGGVLIGMFPVYGVEGGKNMYLSEYIDSTEGIQTNFIDPWGRRLIYAVTQSLTDSSTFSTNGGAIIVKDEFNDDTGGIVSAGPNQRLAHYAVFSQGEDVSCTSIREAENCDLDNTFINSIQYDAQGPTHYDDRLAFYIAYDASLWSEHLNAAGNAVGNAKNENTGNIGINTTAPTEKLDVIGTISTDSFLSSRQLCDDGTTNCIKPESLYNVSCVGPGLDGKYMTGVTIDSGTNRLQATTCSNLVFLPPSTTADCTTHGGVRGIYTSGRTVCDDGSYFD